MRAKAVLSDSGLGRLGGRIEGWRRSPAKSKAMPEALWDAVARAARQHGLEVRQQMLAAHGVRLTIRTRDAGASLMARCPSGARPAAMKHS